MLKIWCLFTKLHPDFHSICILKFHGKSVLQYKTKRVSVILQENFNLLRKLIISVFLVSLVGILT